MVARGSIKDVLVSTSTRAPLITYVACPWRSLQVVWYVPISDNSLAWTYAHEQLPTCMRPWEIEMVDNNHSLSRYLALPYASQIQEQDKGIRSHLISYNGFN
jgi:hypothetical protein